MPPAMANASNRLSTCRFLALLACLCKLQTMVWWSCLCRFISLCLCKLQTTVWWSKRLWKKRRSGRSPTRVSTFLFASTVHLCIDWGHTEEWKTPKGRACHHCQTLFFAAGSQCTIAYTARLPDGTVFDARSEEDPLTFTTDEGAQLGWVIIRQWDGGAGAAALRRTGAGRPSMPTHSTNLASTTRRVEGPPATCCVGRL